MDIEHLVNESWSTAESHGWHAEPRSFGDCIALCHSELSEALEEFRTGSDPAAVSYVNDKPEGVAVELADVIVRIADMCGVYGIDLDNALRVKMEYNRGRPYRHGGKRL